MTSRGAFWTGLTLVLALSRLAHSGILWADEDYHLAGAIQVLAGKVPYRDFWYDKPPLTLGWYLLMLARTGAALRIAGTLFDVLCCLLAFRFAERIWSRAEGYLAAGLLAFCLIFYLPAGIIPIEPDTLMLAPHLAAVYFAWARRPLVAGIVAAIAFWISSKGAFVLAACVLFDPAGALWIIAGFLGLSGAILAWLAGVGAWSGYIEQVWRWGLLYAGSSTGSLKSVANWAGFHIGLAGFAAWWIWKERWPIRWGFAGWIALSLAGVALGWRFAPRYFIQLLPPLVIAASRGFTWIASSRRTLAWTLASVAAVVPVARFGPRYATLIAHGPTGWADVAMDEESQRAAQYIDIRARPGDTIFVWGYRPNIVAYTRLPVGAKLWDSQPLTGVPADRHLSNSTPVDATWAAQNRREVIQSRPTWLVDGLSAYNPSLAMSQFPEMKEWLGSYCESEKIRQIVIYKLCK